LSLKLKVIVFIGWWSERACLSICREACSCCNL